MNITVGTETLCYVSFLTTQERKYSHLVAREFQRRKLASIVCTFAAFLEKVAVK